MSAESSTRTFFLIAISWAINMYLSNFEFGKSVHTVYRQSQPSTIREGMNHLLVDSYGKGTYIHAMAGFKLWTAQFDLASSVLVLCWGSRWSSCGKMEGHSDCILGSLLSRGSLCLFCCLRSHPVQNLVVLTHQVKKLTFGFPSPFLTLHSGPHARCEKNEHSVRCSFLSSARMRVPDIGRFIEETASTGS